jgi:hypothetical protein
LISWVLDQLIRPVIILKHWFNVKFKEEIRIIKQLDIKAKERKFKNSRMEL